MAGSTAGKLDAVPPSGAGALPEAVGIPGRFLWPPLLRAADQDFSYLLGRGLVAQ